MKSLRKLSDAELERKFGVSSEQLSEWDEMACQGELVGEWSGDVVRGPGRPRVLDEEQVIISLRIPLSKKEELEKLSKQKGMTMSSFIRDVLLSTI